MTVVSSKDQDHQLTYARSANPQNGLKSTRSFPREKVGSGMRPSSVQIVDKVVQSQTFQCSVSLIGASLN